MGYQSPYTESLYHTALQVSKQPFQSLIFKSKILIQTNLCSSRVGQTEYRQLGGSSDESGLSSHKSLFKHSRSQFPCLIVCEMQQFINYDIFSHPYTGKILKVKSEITSVFSQTLCLLNALQTNCSSCSGGRKCLSFTRPLVFLSSYLPHMKAS